MKDVKELFKDGLSCVTSTNWQNFDDHVMKVEDEMWQKENLVDQLLADIPPVIITYGTSDDEDDSEDEWADDIEE
jgi:hypothetical protein